MVEKIILLVLYFLQFYLTSFGEKNILPNLTYRRRSRFFWPLGAGAAQKKSGAGAAKKFAGSPALLSVNQQ